MVELYEFNGLFQPKWFTDHILNEITIWSEYKENQADKLLKIQPNPDKLQTSLSKYSLRDSILECHNGKLLKICVCLLVYAKMLSQAQPAPSGHKHLVPVQDKETLLCLSGVRDSVLAFVKPGLMSVGQQLWSCDCSSSHGQFIPVAMPVRDLWKVTWLKNSRA